MRARPITPPELGRTPTPQDVKRMADAAAMLAASIREARLSGRPLPNIFDREAVRDALARLDAAVDPDGTGRLILYRPPGATWPPAAVGQHLIGLDRLRRQVAGRLQEGNVPTLAAADALTGRAGDLARCAAVEAAEPAGAPGLDETALCVLQALRELATTGGLAAFSQGEIAEKAGYARNTIREPLDHLRRAGLAERPPGKAYRHRVTPAGKAALRRLGR